LAPEREMCVVVDFKQKAEAAALVADWFDDEADRLGTRPC
jgi:hypothetical protein